MRSRLVSSFRRQVFSLRGYRLQRGAGCETSQARSLVEEEAVIARWCLLQHRYGSSEHGRRKVQDSAHQRRFLLPFADRARPAVGPARVTPHDPILAGEGGGAHVLCLRQHLGVGRLGALEDGEVDAIDAAHHQCRDSSPSGSSGVISCSLHRHIVPGQIVQPLIVVLHPRVRAGEGPTYPVSWQAVSTQDQRPRRCP